MRNTFHRSSVPFKRWIPVIVLLLAGYGCSTKYVWHHPGKSDAVVKADIVACEEKAARFSYDMGHAGKKSIVEKHMKECMEALGYRWIPEGKVPKKEPVADAAVQSSDAPEVGLLLASNPVTRLRVKNSCEYPIWMQQLNFSSETKAVIKLNSGDSYDYAIPAAGLSSTRLWPKAGCNESGQSCRVGQVLPPCPSDGGCHPDYGSKIEATWGCTLADKTRCGKTPQGDRMLETYFNMSAVDGYSFPFNVSVTAVNDKFKGSCTAIDCSGLELARCPTDEDLSKGQGGSVFPAYKKVNLQVFKSSKKSEILGCYSTCTRFTWSKNTAYPGEGKNPKDPEPRMYCCPTPPISSPDCRKGPVIGTKYVKAVHEMCRKTAYTYAYDDGVGLRHCNAEAAFEVTFGPNCPAQFNKPTVLESAMGTAEAVK